MTSILKTNSFETFKCFMKKRIPQKKDFISSTGFPPFSRNIPILVERGLISPSEAILVGQFSDIMFGIEIARFIDYKKEALFESILDMSVEMYNHFIKNRYILSDEDNMKLDRVIETVKEYIYGKNIESCKVIDCAITIYKAQNLAHYSADNILTGGDILQYFFSPNEEYIIDEVKALVEVFKNKFLDSGIVKKDSDVVYHPYFEPWGSICDGAIADLYIDGMLVDFKSNNKNGYKWLDVAQVYSYYAFNCLCTISENYFNHKCYNIADKKVSSVAIYLSRYGDFEWCNLNASNKLLSERDTFELGKMILEHATERHITSVDMFVPFYNEWKKMLEDS